MKLKLLAVILLVTAFALSGCSSSTETATPTVTVTKEVQSNTGGSSFSADDEYIMYIDSVRPDMVPFYGRSNLIAVGRDTCTFFRDGGTIAQLEQVAMSTIGTEDTAAIAAAAILAYCPDQQYLVESY